MTNCFFHDKRNLSFDTEAVKWILKNTKVCDECKDIIDMRFGVSEDDEKEPTED